MCAFTARLLHNVQLLHKSRHNDPTYGVTGSIANTYIIITVCTPFVAAMIYNRHYVPTVVGRHLNVSNILFSFVLNNVLRIGFWPLLFLDVLSSCCCTLRPRVGYTLSANVHNGHGIG